MPWLDSIGSKKLAPLQIFPMGPLGLLKHYGHMFFSKKLEIVTPVCVWNWFSSILRSKIQLMPLTKSIQGGSKKMVPPQIFPIGPLGLLKVYWHMVFSKKLEMVTLICVWNWFFSILRSKKQLAPWQKSIQGGSKKLVPPQIFPMGPLGLLKVYWHMVFSKKLEMVTLEYRQLLI